MICPSPSVISYCCHDRFIPMIHVIVYFLSILEHFATKFYQSSVCSAWICLVNRFFLFKMFDCISRTQAFFMGFIAVVISCTSSSSPMLHCSFKCFTSSCCSSTFNLTSLLTSMAFHNSLSYCWLPIFVFFSIYPYFPSLYSQIIHPSQQQCFLWNVQSHHLRFIHDRLI